MALKMPNSIQPRDRKITSKGSGMGGVLYKSFAIRMATATCCTSTATMMVRGTGTTTGSTMIGTSTTFPLSPS